MPSQGFERTPLVNSDLRAEISDLEDADEASLPEASLLTQSRDDDFGPSASLSLKHVYRTAAGVAFAVLVGTACTMYATPSDSKGPDSAYESRFENSQLYNEYLCSHFKGMYTPKGDACCPASCGRYCGAGDCQNGPGGYSQCCGSQFTQKCGGNVTAPCNLDLATPFEAVSLECGKYGGIDHPLGTKCCDAKCGALCGAKNCWRAGPGYVGCCSSHLDKYCGTNTYKAPCMLGQEPLSQECKDYGGIEHPMGSKCCGKKCGSLCGSPKCWKGHGGAESCCRSMEGLPRCGPGVEAPCNLVPPVSNVFSGTLSVETSAPSAFKNSPECGAAVQNAIASSLKIDLDSVTFDSVGFKGFQVQYRYSIKVPIDSKVTMEQVTGLQKDMAKTLNGNLEREGLTLRAIEVDMPPPEIRQTSMTTSTTVTTTSSTTILTCASIDCPSGQVLREEPEKIACPAFGCTTEECCLAAPPTVSPQSFTGAQAEVPVSLTVSNVDFDLLQADPTLMTAFEDQTKSAIALEAGSGVSSADVTLTLSAGSSRLLSEASVLRKLSGSSVSTHVEALIHVPGNTDASTVLDAVTASTESGSFETTLVESINDTPGISAAKTGEIGTADLVYEKKVIYVTTTAPPTTSGPEDECCACPAADDTTSAAVVTTTVAADATTTAASGAATTTAAADDTTTAADGATTTAAADDTTTKADDATTTSAADDTTTKADDATTTSAADDTTTKAADATTTAAADDTTTAADGATTTSAADDTTTSGDDATTPSAADDTTTKAAGAATTAAADDNSTKAAEDTVDTTTVAPDPTTTVAAGKASIAKKCCVCPAKSTIVTTTAAADETTTVAAAAATTTAAADDTTTAADDAKTTSAADDSTTAADDATTTGAADATTTAADDAATTTVASD